MKVCKKTIVRLFEEALIVISLCLDHTLKNRCKISKKTSKQQLSVHKMLTMSFF